MAPPRQRVNDRVDVGHHRTVAKGQVQHPAMQRLEIVVPGHMNLGKGGKGLPGRAGRKGWILGGALIQLGRHRRCGEGTSRPFPVWPGNRRLPLMTAESNQAWTCYARSRRSHLRRNRRVFSKLPPKKNVSSRNDTLSNVTGGNDSPGLGRCQELAPRFFCPEDNYRPAHGG